MSGLKKRFEDTIKYLDREEWNKLQKAAQRSSPRDHLITQMLYDSGMRVGELCTTRLEDIDFENRFIRIQSFRSKTKRARTARLSKGTLDLIRGYIGNRRDGYIFESRGKHLSTRRIEQLILKLAESSGIQSICGSGKDGKKLRKVTPHTLRHTHIVHALMRHVPLNAVQAQVGHADIRTTQIYAGLAPEQVRAAYDGFEMRCDQ